MPLARYIPPAAVRELAQRISDPLLRVQVFADIARFNTLYMIMKAGSGHIGSSFSAMDLVSWLYLEELNQETSSEARADIYFSSKGHDAPGLYAVLIGHGMLPEENLHQLRRIGGLPGHPDVGTDHMVTNTGSLGMGISKAKGIVQAARLDGQRQRVFVMTGDGELQEGQIWESLISAANRQMGEITVIVDHNKIQSDTWIKEVSDLGDLEAKFDAFGWEVARIDGHDMPAFRDTLEQFAKITERPKVIIADTIKGRGVSFMESTAFSDEFGLYQYHSGAPAADSYEKSTAELFDKILELLAPEKLPPPAVVETEVPAKAAAAGERLVGAYAQALLSAGQRRDDVVVLDGDLMLDCGLIPFKEAFPDRFLECGIAEMDMVSQAGGLALAGKLPIVHSFACFLSTRPNEHIYNNATESTKVVYVGSLAGLVPGGPGHSHQSVRDISALAGVPGLTMIEPACEREVELALEWALEVNNLSTYLRLISIPVSTNFSLPNDYKLEKGKGVEIASQGEDFAVITYGAILLTEATTALQALAGNGLKGTLINLPWLNVLDSDWLRETAERFPCLVSLENHYERGGQGDVIGRTLAELNLPGPPRFTSVGVRAIPVCGTNPEVLLAHELDGTSIERMIREFQQ